MPEENASLDPFLTELSKALPEANIPTLLLLNYQLTGDEKWLKPPFEPVRSRGLDDNDSGGLSEDLQSQVRDGAYEAIRAWRAGRPMAIENPDIEVLSKMMTVSEGEAIDAEYAEVMVDKLRRFAGAKPPKVKVPEDFNVLIIGAGMSGVAAAIKLDQAGIPYTIVEKRGGVGGVWHWHDYPNCGVDTPSHLYSYSFAGGDWSDYYALRPEIEGYFDGVADSFGIKDKIRFNTEVMVTRYDEDAHVWVSTLRNGDGSIETLVTTAVISAVGQFTTPKWPAIPGLREFDGQVVHTAEWDHDIELEGKRVAVIGNGASAMQIVPAIADRVGELTIFQRSRQWAAPFTKFRKPVSDSVRFLLREVPQYSWLYRLRLSWIFDSKVYPTLQKDPDWHDPEHSLNAANDGHRRFFTRYIREQLGDREDLAERVIPDFPPFGKRMLLDNGWFRTLTKPNVELVDGGVERVEGNRVYGPDGIGHEVDVVLVATGYEVVRYLAPVEVVGKNELTVREAWDDDDARAYLGTAVPGFPNFFMLYGPNTQLGHGGSFIFIVECQIDYLLSVFDQMSKQGLASVEVREEVYDRYNEDVQAQHQKMVWSHPGMSTYFRNAKGRIVTQNPWRLVDVWRFTRQADLSDYVTVPAAEAADVQEAELSSMVRF